MVELEYHEPARSEPLDPLRQGAADRRLVGEAVDVDDEVGALVLAHRAAARRPQVLEPGSAVVAVELHDRRAGELGMVPDEIVDRRRGVHQAGGRLDGQHRLWGRGLDRAQLDQRAGPAEPQLERPAGIVPDGGHGREVVGPGLRTQIDDLHDIARVAPAAPVGGSAQDVTATGTGRMSAASSPAA